MAADQTDDGGPSPGPFPDCFRRRLLRQLATELGPLAVFFLAFLAAGLLWATAAYALAAALAFAAAWQLHGRLPVLPAITALLVFVLAGLTLALDDATFIKIKPTVINGFYGSLLLGGWLAGYRLVARVLGPDAALDRAGERQVTIAAGLYLAGLAIANEFAWRTLETEHWVLFKVFVLTACNLVFGWSQLPVIRRHLRRDSQPPAPPDGAGQTDGDRHRTAATGPAV
ncbi:inner membrane-spanning protein YciB [Marinibaculum pumilum]|uniref:Inner membrane-spanning protein YciB n=1 Tax=Marinibaculum pumilum TaxID=1766165 RepID=A0ABV7L159_9PROT